MGSDNRQSDGDQGDARRDQQARRLVRDDRRIELGIYQPVIGGGVAPQRQQDQAGRRQAERVEDRGGAQAAEVAKHVRGNRQERDRHQEEHVEPEQPAVAARDIVKDALVRHPIYAYDNEAEGIHRGGWPEEANQRSRQQVGRHAGGDADREDQQRGGGGGE